MDGDAGDLDAGPERVADSVRTRKGWQQGRVDIDDWALHAGKRLGAEDTHVAGQHYQLRPDRGQRFGQDIVGRRPLLRLAELGNGHDQGVYPLLHRPLDGGAIAIGEDEGDLGVQSAPLGGGLQGPQVAAETRNSNRDSMCHAIPRYISEYLAADESTATTKPMGQAGRPSSARLESVLSTALDGTTATIPSPPLNVDLSSASDRPPSAPMSRIIDGIGHAAGLTRAASPSGSTRGTLPGSPPPVMWETPRNSEPASSSRRRRLRMAFE